MTQQDYTAPEWAVKVSRKERFQQVFQVFMEDGITPDNSLASLLFFADLLDKSGLRHATATCTRPAAYAVQVDLTTAQMNALVVGRYRLEVYSLSGGEREDLVTVLLEAE